MTDAPITFVSHASEDKERFVRPLAVELRAMGIDAWLDEWEIAGGDSLVARIFDDGIDRAAAFVIVVSSSSVDKPWVREELDAAVIRRIQQRTRLIPVLLDHVDMPAALKHLKWIDATDLDVQKAATEVGRSIFGTSIKPSLGRAPVYVTQEQVLLADPHDDLVLTTLIQLAFESNGLNASSDVLLKLLEPAGLTKEAIAESAEILVKRGYIEQQKFLGGGFALRELNLGVVLAILPSRGIDVTETAGRLLAHIGNHRTPSGFEVPNLLIRDALIHYLENKGWIEVLPRMMGGDVFAEITAAGMRILRQT